MPGWLQRAAVGAIALMGIGLLGWATTEYFTIRAIRELNREVDEKITAEQLVQESLQSNAANLAQVAKPDALLHMRSQDLIDTVTRALDIAVKSKNLPITIGDVRVRMHHQAVDFSAAVQGNDKESGVSIKGQVEGVVVVRFRDRDVLFRPAARKITLESLKVARWTWLPSSVVRVANPLVARVLSTLNGETPEVPTTVLPKPSPAVKVKVGSSEVALPEMSTKSPAVLIDESGLYVMVQMTGPVDKAKPASTFESFREAFFAKAAKRFSTSPKFRPGFQLADELLTQVLGPLRAPGSVEDLAKQAVLQNAKALTELRGPDIVLRISANEARDLIGSFLIEAVGKLQGDGYTIQDPQYGLDEGVISISARLLTTTKYGNGQLAQGRWGLAVAAVPSAEDNGKSLSLTPRVQKVVLQELTLSGGTPDFAFLLPAINAALENLTTEINRIVPRIPLDLPVVTPGEVKIQPIKAAGLSASVTPDKFLPVGVRLSKALIATSSAGMWILADVDPADPAPVGPESAGQPAAAGAPVAPAKERLIADIPKLLAASVLPPRQAVGTAVVNPSTATAQSLDIAIDKLVRLRYGDLPAAPIFAVASWQRFATLFNLQWRRLAPRVNVEFDTGTVSLGTQRVNLVDYARFECKRTRECNRAPCRQRACEFRGCSRGSCGSCGEVELKSCAFGGCVVWFRGRDAACEAGKAVCDIAAEAALGACNVAANAEKAACDATAVAEKAGCDIREEAGLFDCNRLAEQEVAFCDIKKGLTNAAAEISGVGAIGGDARARGRLNINLSYLLLNEEQPEVAFLPIVDGEIRGDLGINWTPYDVLGHVFVCPTRGKVFVNSTASFNRVQPKVTASINVNAAGGAQNVASQNASAGSKLPSLVVKVDAFKVPMRMEPGLLNSLYRNNPQISVTCPIASGLLGIPGLLIGNSFRAVSESDLSRMLATGTLSAATAPLMYVDDNVRAGMGILFGGKFDVPVGEMHQEIPYSHSEMELPGGTLTFVSTLDAKAFKLAVKQVRKPQPAKQK